MLLSMVARGQDFNPDSPPEPGARYKLTLKAQPAEAATVSGGGLYAVNANVSVKAVAKSSNWRFKNWTDAEGKVVSTSSSFTHRKLNSAETLTANYEYQKTSRLTIAYDPSSIRASEVKEYVVGVTYSFTASTYSDYTFVNWTTSDGTVISTNRAVSYTVTETTRPSPPTTASRRAVRLSLTRRNRSIRSTSGATPQVWQGSIRATASRCLRAARSA